MKNTIFAFILTFFLIGCSHDNGFAQFELTPIQQKWENNQVFVAVRHNDKIAGTITAVYLNKVMPEFYKNGEYFFISFYQKDRSVKLDLYLNGHSSLLFQKIEKVDAPYGKLIADTPQWSQLYIVGFAKISKKDTLGLTIANDGYTADKMVFKKRE
ncbi:MAG: hypothetical protein FAF05_00285 [Epsilonproteobacteria bacterium]|nr:hypothetical protein [Campylobacterota bacterium]